MRSFQVWNMRQMYAIDIILHTPGTHVHVRQWCIGPSIIIQLRFCCMKMFFCGDIGCFSVFCACVSRIAVSILLYSSGISSFYSYIIPDGTEHLDPLIWLQCLLVLHMYFLQRWNFEDLCHVTVRFFLTRCFHLSLWQLLLPHSGSITVEYRQFIMIEIIISAEMLCEGSINLSKSQDLHLPPTAWNGLLPWEAKHLYVGEFEHGRGGIFL